jgi:putative hemolysin
MTEVLIILGLILISAFSAGAETGAYCLNRIRLRLRESQGDWRAVRLAALLRDRHRFVATMLGATNLTRYAATAVATYSFAALAVRHPDLVATACLTPVTLLLGEILPKALFATHANTLMYRLTLPIRLTAVLLWPLATVLVAVMELFSAILGREEADGMGILTTARLSYFLAEGRRGGAITEEQDRIARNILEIQKRPVERAMVPLEKVDMIPLDITPAELRRHAAGTHYARLPVYERERAHIVGVLVLLEFLWAEPEPASIADCVRPAARLAAGLPIDEALLALRRARQPMGIVTDESGRAVGLVTIKDLVEEIVGELKEW